MVANFLPSGRSKKPFLLTLENRENPKTLNRRTHNYFTRISQSKKSTLSSSAGFLKARLP
ncbi:MAG: hypothetical protein C0168_09675 [Candidatus Aminicenantes bacterium]|nr:MAG: hypothetical protein C0168_09675 [Candidatus Aminicenantes bacterium]